MTTTEPLPRGEIIQQLDGTYELFSLPTDEDTLRGVLLDCLAEWEHVRIGMLVPGAVWEIKPPCQPRTGFLDGYLTVDFEEWHLHLCIGESKAASTGNGQAAAHRAGGTVPEAQSGPPADIVGVPPV